MITNVNELFHIFANIVIDYETVSHSSLLSGVFYNLPKKNVSPCNV